MQPVGGYRTLKRLAHVFVRRTKEEFSIFCQAPAAAYPAAIKNHLVLDNLNTHNASAFYENLSADAAFALAERFAFYYTPKSASWLNMIAIEFSALARLCLHRRIPTMDKLKREVLAIAAERHAKRIKINWQFSPTAAREKPNSRYVVVNEKNKVFSKC